MALQAKCAHWVWLIVAIGISCSLILILFFVDFPLRALSVKSSDEDLQSSPARRLRLRRRQECTLPSHLKIRTLPNRSQWFLDLLRGPVTCFTRWSDGEWLAAGQSILEDSNGGIPFQLGRSLWQSLYAGDDVHGVLRFINKDWFCQERPDGLYDLAKNLLGGIPEAQQPEFLDHFGLLTALHEPLVFREIVAQLRGNCILVGPPHFQQLMGSGSLLECIDHVILPCCNKPFSIMGSLLPEIETAASRLGPSRGYVLISGGLSTKVIIPRLAPGLGRRHSLIDAGSSLDLFCGVHDRDYNDEASLEHWCQWYGDYLKECSANDL